LLRFLPGQPVQERGGQCTPGRGSDRDRHRGRGRSRGD
jgi:hypothetical protein